MRMRHNDRGVFFILALYLTSFLALAVLVNLTQSVTQMRSAELYVDHVQALHVAEAGIEEALFEFMSGGTDGEVNFSLSEDWYEPNTNPKVACTTGCERTVTVGGDSTTVTIDDISATQRQITSAGLTDGRTQTVEVVVEDPVAAPFSAALYGSDSITLGMDGTIDSYNSNLGAYGAVLATADPVYGNLNKSALDNASSLNGDMRVDSTVAGALALQTSGSSIYGDGIVAPTGDPNQVIDDSGGTIHGTKYAASALNDWPDPKPPNATLGSIDYVTSAAEETIDLSTCGCRSITVTGSTTLTLTGTGTLKLTSLNINTGGKFKVTGNNVSLVVDSIAASMDSSFESDGQRLKVYGTGVGAITFAKSNVASSSQDPNDLKFYLKGTNTFTVKKESYFYGAIYAPNATVSLDKEAEVFGSVIGKNIVIDKDAKIHYDEDLADETLKVTGKAMTIKSWRLRKPNE